LVMLPPFYNPFLLRHHKQMPSITNKINATVIAINNIFWCFVNGINGGFL
jgi:hypothetical protein